MANAIEFSIKALDNFSSVMDKQFNQMTRLESAFAALGVTAAVYGALNLAKQSLDNAEAMGVAATKANMSVEAFSKLAFAASQSNVELGTLETGMRGLNKAMAEDVTKGGGLQLQQLGIAARDANGVLRSTRDVLADVADAFEQGTDDATKNKVAMELFGKAGLGMIPMLNQGSEAIAKMEIRANQLGQVISGDFAAAADQINDNLAQMGMVVSGSVNVAMTELAPIIQMLTTELVDMATEGDKVQKAGQSIATIMRVIMSIGATLVGVFDALGTAIGATAASVVLFLSGDFKGAAKTYTEGFTQIGTVIGETAGKITGYWDGTADAAAAAAAKTGEALRKTKGEMATSNAATEKAIKAAEDLKKSIYDTEKSLNAQIQTMGMSAGATKRYELSLKGATDQQLKGIDAAIARQDAEKTSAEKMAAGGAIIEGLRTQEEQFNLTRLQTITTMLEGGFAAEQLNEALSRQALAWESARISTQEYKDGVTDAMLSASETMAVHLQEMGSASFQMGQMIESVAMTMIKGVGDSIAAVIVDGADLQTALANVAKQVMKTVISTLIQIGIQRLILSMIGRSVDIMEGATKLGTTASLTYGAAFLASASMGPVGLAAAPAVAATAVATMLAGATTSKGAGAAVGSIPAAHGGLDYVPSETTYLLDKGERVLSPRQNTDLTSFLDNQGGGGGGTVIQNLTIHILENATNTDAFARMDKIELRNTLGQPVVDALNEMFSIGVRPDFAMQGR